jgi:hypothetical protein
VGLSVAHNSPQRSANITYGVEIAKGATYAKLTVKGGSRIGGGQRGQVRGFSSASRKRLMDLFNKMDKAKRGNALFITLTYPGQYPDFWADWKRHLDTFCKRLVRLWPKASLIWKLEFQKRGAPHFHMIVWGIPKLPKRWLSAVWYAIVGSNDPKHLQAGTNVERVRKDEKIIGYIAKYFTKDGDSRLDIVTGRTWGSRGVKHLPILIYHLRLDVRVFYELRRVLRAWIAHKLKRGRMWGKRPGIGITAYLSEGDLVGLLSLAVDKFEMVQG